jgi:Archaeal Peptidase A24 C-terminus Type II.
MLMSEMFDCIRVTAVLAVLLYASVSDVRSREVTDNCWRMLGAFGLCCMTYSAFSEGMRWEYVMMIIGAAMILLDILTGVMDGKFGKIFRVLMLLMFVIPLAVSFDDMLVKQFFMIFATFVMFIGMFFTGIIKGGADVKCLIVISMIFFSYPSFSVFPLIASPGPSYEIIFQFSLMVLLFAALFSLSTVFYVMSKNLKNNDGSKKGYMGFMMNIDEAMSSHVWPLQYVSEGNVVTTWKTQDLSVLDDLRAAGEEKVLVTPMVPFLVPMTVAVILLVLIGNPYFIIL